MDLYVVSVLVASILIVPFTIKTFCPYLWKDLQYVVVLLRILVKFASRRRRRPLFSVLDRFLEQSAAHRDKPFIVFGEDSFSYSATDARSNKVANALRAHPGFTAGDTVALFMGNEPAFLITWLALAKLGSPVALLNHNIRTKSLLHCFSCCRAKVLISAPGMKLSAQLFTLEIQALHETRKLLLHLHWGWIYTAKLNSLCLSQFKPSPAQTTF